MARVRPWLLLLALGAGLAAAWWLGAGGGSGTSMLPPHQTSQEVDPHHEPWARFVGMELGAWRVGFQPIGQAVRWHPTPLEVGEGLRRVELDFGPP